MSIDGLGSGVDPTIWNDGLGVGGPGGPEGPHGPQGPQGAQTLTIQEGSPQAMQLARGGGKPPLAPPPKHHNDHGVEGAATRLNELAADLENGDMNITQLLQLFHEISKINREQARQERAHSRDAQISELGKAAGEIRKAATMALVSGVVQGSLAIAGGAMQMRGGFKAAAKTKGTFSTMKQQNQQIQLKNSQGAFQKSQTNMTNAQTKVNAAKTDVQTKTTALNKAKTEQQLMAKQHGPNSPQAKNANANVAKREADLAASKKGLAAEQKNFAKAEKDFIKSKDSFAKAQQKSKLDDQTKAETLNKDKAEIEQIDQNVGRRADMVTQESQQISSKWQGASGIAQGTGQAVGAGLDAQAKEHEARQKERETEATQLEHIANDANEMMRALGDMLKDIRDKLNGILTSRNESMKNIARA